MYGVGSGAPSHEDSACHRCDLRIGLAVCRELLSKGYSIIGIGRDAERCKKAEERLGSDFPDSEVKYFCADLMQQSEVVRVATEN
jgi:NADP-dependent 3-hydroxy acid dehydrogenase YdfG